MLAQGVIEQIDIQLLIKVGQLLIESFAHRKLVRSILILSSAILPLEGSRNDQFLFTGKKLVLVSTSY